MAETWKNGQLSSDYVIQQPSGSIKEVSVLEMEDELIKEF
jgi:hypothetical protein